MTGTRHEGLAPEHAALQLAGRTRSVIVTAGDRGAFCAEAGSCRQIEAPRVQAVDTTGAGDAFVGVLAARLADQLSLPDACRHAVTAASLSVSRPGAQQSYPDSAQLAAALE